MRLLNCQTREIEDFISDEDRPAYGILSHTWQQQEVSFNDWKVLSTAQLQAKKGYKKIDYICRQSKEDGIDWVWVDTCCIDKSSSAELLEAINSMFRFYKKSSAKRQLAASRWFTRGWTLQELIAPAEARFFDAEWNFIGTKSELRDMLSEITHIGVAVLLGQGLESASIAQRMSWASWRKTSRVEDVAYCLLGIFDINMPLLYGEGKKAFRRLQKEIMQTYPYDPSLFAWGNFVRAPVLDPKAEGFVSNPDITLMRDMEHLQSIPWSDEASRRPLRGLLAESPRDFAFSSEVVPCTSLVKEHYQTANFGRSPEFPAAINNEVSISLPTVQIWDAYRIGLNCAIHRTQPKIVQSRTVVFLLLFCQKCPEDGRGGGSNDSADDDVFALPLVFCGRKNFARTDVIIVTSSEYQDRSSSTGNKIFVDPEGPLRLQDGDILLGTGDLLHFNFGCNAETVARTCVYLGESLIRPILGATGALFAFMIGHFHYCVEEFFRDKAWVVRVSRIADETDYRLSAAIMRVDCGVGPDGTDSSLSEMGGIDSEGRFWYPVTDPRGMGQWMSIMSDETYLRERADDNVLKLEEGLWIYIAADCIALEGQEGRVEVIWVKVLGVPKRDMEIDPYMDSDFYPGKHFHGAYIP